MLHGDLVVALIKMPSPFSGDELKNSLNLQWAILLAKEGGHMDSVFEDWGMYKWKKIYSSHRCERERSSSMVLALVMASLQILGAQGKSFS